jgi:aspartate carbamoyltransferase catalytic subunit
VARSNIHLLTKLGAKVRIAGPGTLVPREFGELVEEGIRIEPRIEGAIEGADVVMILRIQRERQDAAFFPSMREYAVHYGLHLDHLERAAPDAIVMHPGPMNRGIEIASEVADGARSLILDQVTNGLAVRMAVLYLLVSGTPSVPVVDEALTQRNAKEQVRDQGRKRGSEKVKERGRGQG